MECFIKESKNTFGAIEPKIWDTDHPYQGEKAQIGSKWVGVLRLVSHHTNRVDLNGMFYLGAKENILSQ